MSTALEIPEPVLIGYFAKPTMKRPEWLTAMHVEEVCCWVNCRIEFDWVNDWLHNAEWVFNTPALALGVVPEPYRTECDLFAYRLYPIRYRNGISEPYVLPAPSDAEVMGFDPQPIDTTFERLGCDLIPRYCENAFECSPFCCNNLASEVPTNGYCLLDTVEEAFALAPTLEAPGKPPRGEPGPYHIVEVWRKRRT